MTRETLRIPDQMLQDSEIFEVQTAVEEADIITRTRGPDN